jgi:choloylglycine hydrolase
MGSMVSVPEHYMERKMKYDSWYGLAAVAMLTTTGLGLLSPDVHACSRATYLGKDGVVITGRSMDWAEKMHEVMYVLPRGMKRNGEAGVNSVNWTSKYGSVVIAPYDIATADGMNEKGVVANLLWLAEADYGPRDPSRPGLTIAAWTQYVLDNFASVEEAVAAFEISNLQIVSARFGDSFSKLAKLHLAISDATGDSAILEVLNGKTVIHHGRQYQVMTNSPIYEQQLALNVYWGGLASEMLPGTNRASDRFVRASYYLAHLPATAEPRETLGGVFSVIRNVSQPFGAPDPSAPNIAPTLFRTVSDQKQLVYYYESTLSPNIVWVALNSVELSEGQSVKKIKVSERFDLVGDVSGQFQPADMFHFRTASQ